MVIDLFIHQTIHGEKMLGHGFGVGWLSPKPIIPQTIQLGFPHSTTMYHHFLDNPNAPIWLVHLKCKITGLEMFGTCYCSSIPIPTSMQLASIGIFLGGEFSHPYPSGAKGPQVTDVVHVDLSQVRAGPLWIRTRCATNRLSFCFQQGMQRRFSLLRTRPPSRLRIRVIVLAAPDQFHQRYYSLPLTSSTIGFK